PDLVVTNQFDGTTTQLNSYVYWGSSKGFDARNRIELPTQGAEAVAVADLNGDGWPEIVFALSGLTYHMAEDRFQQSYIYWGNKGAYSPERRSSLPTLNWAVKVGAFIMRTQASLALTGRRCMPSRFLECGFPVSVSAVENGFH
ncbi:MAG: FG-GAP-like repeat-containing protein, partial [Terriglobales bacterium]